MRRWEGNETRKAAASVRVALAAAMAAAVAVLAAPVLAGIEEAPPEGAEIRDLRVENTAHELLASFALRGGFSPEILEQIESGLPVTFNHYVEINKRRPLWFDSTMVKKVISASVTYDTLTRQFRLSRSVNGEVMETDVSDKRAEMERFMTSVDRLRLCDPSDLPSDQPLYLRVKSRVQKRFVLFFIPWDFETSWARVGLSLPPPTARENGAP